MAALIVEQARNATQCCHPESPEAASPVYIVFLRQQLVQMAERYAAAVERHEAEIHRILERIELLHRESPLERLIRRLGGRDDGRQ